MAIMEDMCRSTPELKFKFLLCLISSVSLFHTDADILERSLRHMHTLFDRPQELQQTAISLGVIDMVTRACICVNVCV